MTDNRVEFTAADLRWLEELVAVPSVSPFEGGDPSETVRAQEVFVRSAEARGFITVLHGTPPPTVLEQAGVPKRVLGAHARDPEGFLSSQPSVVVAMGTALDAERTLVINFHIDTVSPHVPPTWSGGTLKGRGAADDKGPGVAATIGVAAAFAMRPDLADRVRVQIASVAGEEGGAMGVYGTRWLVDRGYNGRLMIFAEPTGMAVLDACTATMTASIRIKGVDATDDYPTGGHNASLALGWIACFLARYYSPMVQDYGGKLTIGGLHTGYHHNRVYGSGELLINVAYQSFVAAAALEEGLQALLSRSKVAFVSDMQGIPIAERLVEDWAEVVEFEWLKRGIPPLVNEDPDLRSLFHSVGLEWTDGIADDTAFTCDAVWAASKDRYVVVCGPGALDHNRAHTPDEWMHVEDLEAYATKIRDLVVQFADLDGNSYTTDAWERKGVS